MPAKLHHIGVFMKNLVLVLTVLLGLPAFAHADELDRQIEFAAQQLQRLVINQRQHTSLHPQQKSALLRQIQNATQTLSGGYQPPQPVPQPQPIPQPQYSPAQCGWFDGQSNGISQRGWHAFRQMNGIHYSLQFYGNNSYSSAEKCNIDVIFTHDAYSYANEVAYAKQTSCQCGWFPGDTYNTPSTRGWHMFYKVRSTGGTEISLSAGSYGNNSTASQETCNRALVTNNFVCR